MICCKYGSEVFTVIEVQCSRLSGHYIKLLYHTCSRIDAVAIAGVRVIHADTL